MRKILIPLLALSVIGLQSCYNRSWEDHIRTVARAKYNVALKSGTVDGSPIQSIKGNPMGFSDENFSFLFEMGKSLQLDITNKTPKTVKVIWDESVFIFNNGVSDKIVTGSTKVADRTRSITSSIIPSKSRLNEALIPLSKINIGSRGYYSYDSLMPYRMPTTANWEEVDELRDIVQKLEGADLPDVLLTIEVDGKKTEYFFDFYIESTEFIDVSSKENT